MSDDDEMMRLVDEYVQNLAALAHTMRRVKEEIRALDGDEPALPSRKA